MRSWFPLVSHQLRNPCCMCPKHNKKRRNATLPLPGDSILFCEREWVDNHAAGVVSQRRAVVLVSLLNSPGCLNQAFHQRLPAQKRGSRIIIIIVIIIAVVDDPSPHSLSLIPTLFSSSSSSSSSSKQNAVIMKAPKRKKKKSPNPEMRSFTLLSPLVFQAA